METDKGSLSTPDYASGLTAYNHDGLELYIHTDGSVYASNNAMARMLGMQNGHLSSVINRGNKGEYLYPVLRVENGSQYGIKGESLYGVDTLVLLAAKYNPSLSVQFAKMGANVYLYQLAGYKVGIQPTVEMSEREKDQRIIVAMTQKVALDNYADINPNFKAKIDFIVENNGVLGGKMTLNEFNDSRGVSMTLSEKKAVGRGMAEMTRKETGESPTSRTVKMANSKGGYNYIQLKEYPVSLMPEYNSLCRQRGIAK